MTMLVLVCGLFLSTNQLQAQCNSFNVDFKQAANRDNFGTYTTGELHWIGSILQNSNSRYVEGMSTLQRIVMNNLTTACSGSCTHTLRVKFESEKNGNHAYDFITSWDNAIQAANGVYGTGAWAIAPGFGLMPANRADPKLHECDDAIGACSETACNLVTNGGIGTGAGATFRDLPVIDGETNLIIPGDQNTTTNIITEYESRYGNRTVRVYVDGGTFGGANGDVNNRVVFVGYGNSNPNDGGDTYMYYDIIWTSCSPNVVIEFAAHIAVGVDGLDPNPNDLDLGVGYFVGQGASDISGGPYHVIVEGFIGADGTTGTACEPNLGNLDNQLQGSQVLLIPRCDLTGPATACTNTSVQYSTTNVNLQDPTFLWTIINSNQTTPATITSGNATTVGPITVNTGSVGSYTVKFQITNGGGTTTTDDDIISSCTVTTTVSGGPTITCPTNQAAAACLTQAQVDAAFVAWLATVTSNGTVTHNGGTTGPNRCGGTKTVVFTASNTCGTATCSATFSVTADNTPPAFTGSYSNVTLGCNPSDISGSLNGATATDACGAPTITQSDGAVQSTGCARSQTRTFTARDACNNTATISRTVTWTADVTPPSFTGSYSNVTLGCNPSGADINTALDGATATDACGPTTISQSDGPVGSTGCSRSQTRTFTARDGCGNTATIGRTVTWTADVTPPVFTGSYTTVNLGCNPVASDVTGALGTATATDACGPVTITQSDGSINTTSCGNTQTRTFTARDACGNTATTSRTVTWTADVTPPGFTGSYANVPLGCNPAASDISAALDGATATDNCGPTTITQSDGPVNSDGCLRIQTRTFTARDGCGNTATVSRSVSWTADVTPPGFTGSYTNVALGCNPAASDITAALNGATATDNCGPTTISQSDGPVGSTGCSRSQTRTFVARDGCGNTASVSRTVTWTADVTPPSFTGSYTNVPLGCNPAASDITGALNGATATDACGPVTISQSDGPVGSDGCSRSQTRTFVARDGCGNTASVSRTVTWIADVTPPGFTGSYTNVALGCNPAASDINSALDGATATDACGPVTISQSDGPVGSTGCSRSQTRTFVARDGCGNTASISRTVTWTADVTAPVITTGGTTTSLGCNPAASDINNALGTATATDACGVPTVTQSDGPVGSTGCSRSQTRTWTARDACGNTSTASRTVTWTADVTPPVFTNCPASTTTACGATPVFGTPTASDACGTPTITQLGTDVVQGTCPTTHTRRWVARDACGNTSTCSQTITVPCCAVNCTYTQGAYGTEGGLMCDGTDSPNNPYTTLEMIEHNLLAYGGLLRVGCPGHSVTIATGQAQCVIDVLPGGGPSGPLPAGDYSICSLPSSLLKNGRINNALLAQTITLGLNLGINPGTLGNFALQPNQWLVTADVEDCGSTTVASCEYNCVPNVLAPGTYIWSVTYNPYHVSDCRISQAIYDALTTKNVAGLYAFANSILCGTALPAGVSYSDVTNAVDCINNAFDECRSFIEWRSGDRPSAASYCPLPSATTPCPVVSASSITRITPETTEANQLTVTAYPNPFRDQVRFVINSDVSGQASLEVYNMLGQRIQTVYTGNIVAGRAQVVEYEAPRTVNGGMIYILKQNGKQVTGKLLNIE